MWSRVAVGVGSLELIQTIRDPNDNYRCCQMWTDLTYTTDILKTSKRCTNGARDIITDYVDYVTSL